MVTGRAMDDARTTRAMMRAFRTAFSFQECRGFLPNGTTLSSVRRVDESSENSGFLLIRRITVMAPGDPRDRPGWAVKRPETLEESRARRKTVEEPHVRSHPHDRRCDALG